MKRNKGLLFINIFGLAVGLTCCILMLLWVQNELSYENFHTNRDYLYRVISEKNRSGNKTNDARGANALGPGLKKNYPEITNFARFRHGFSGGQMQYQEKSFLNDMLCTADPSFFELFTFPFIKGDPKTAFHDRYSIVMTENRVEKYFGSEEPLNKIIQLEGENFTVTGVIKNIPRNSFIQFDFVFPIENMADWWGDPLDSWKSVH